MQNTVFSTKKTLNIRGRLVTLDVPKVMGVLNVTPDSFFDGGRFQSPGAMLTHVEKMVRDGADFIDVGGYSTRPGAEDVVLQDEIERVVSAIKIIVREFPETPVSVDTFRSAVASAAIGEGASMINDISGGQLDGAMFDTVASLGVPYVLMHMRGTPQTMASLTHYDDLLGNVLTYFHQKVQMLRAKGVVDIVIDPGFGFAKTREQNFLLLNNMEHLKMLDRPIMAGLSRKSLVWKTLGVKPDDALNGSTALHAVALLRGANILRVHDVKEAKEVVRLVGELSAPT